MVSKKRPASNDDSGPTPEPGSGAEGDLAAAVKASAQQIWLAGMGAFSKAQAEGSKVFEALVKEGQQLQKKTQTVAEEKLGDFTGQLASRISAMADSVTAKAGQNWDRLESLFEERTAQALGRLGVPTAEEVQALVRRVDALATAVEQLAAAVAAQAQAAAPAAKKTAARRRTAAPSTSTGAAPRKIQRPPKSPAE
jgi:poly(hydroxyalkanoate) granule-associated protein